MGEVTVGMGLGGRKVSVEIEYPIGKNNNREYQNIYHEKETSDICREILKTNVQFLVVKIIIVIMGSLQKARHFVFHHI